MVLILCIMKYYLYKLYNLFSTRCNVVKSLNYFYIKLDKSAISFAKYFASTCVGRALFGRFKRPAESVTRRRLRCLENFIFTFVIQLILIATIGHVYSGNLENMTKNHLEIAPLVTLSLLVCAFSNLFMAAFRDPGTIPRALNRQETGWLTQPPVPMIVNVRGQDIKLPWCETCGFWRPPRASHCRTCDRCVMKLDHHCPWLGNCIGARNYKYFVWFVIWFNCLLAWGIITSFTHISDMAKEAGVPLTINTVVTLLGFSPWTLIVLALILFSIPMPMLMLFHLHIIAIAMTTREMIAWRNLNLGCGVKFRSPYSQGSVLLNFIEIFWGPTPPSLIRNSPKYNGYMKEEPDESMPFAISGRPIKKSIVKLV